MVLNFVLLHSYLVLYCGIFHRTNPDFDDPRFDIIDCILKAQEEESSLENCML